MRATVRWESDAELLASAAPPLMDYEREAIRALREAAQAGARIVLGEVGNLSLWAFKDGEPDRLLAVAPYDGRNPHPMWTQAQRWAREAGVVVPGLLDTVDAPAAPARRAAA